MLIKGILISLLLLILTPLQVLTKRGGYMNFQFLCYQNPGHLDHIGRSCDSVPSRNCDPYFEICISNRPIQGDSSASCTVTHIKTEPFNNEERVCNTPMDNRAALRSIPEIELPYPLQETYYIRILVKDSDQFNDHGMIAQFYASYSGIPSPNFNKFVPSIIAMNRQETRFSNPRASLTISIGLKCDWNLYGNLCITFCRFNAGDSYTCSKDGRKICKPGWVGDHCLRKDLCRNIKCVKGASCIYINEVPKCSCDGMIGPQCYRDYNPCKPNPCLNSGKCIKESNFNGGISCSCKFPYRGSRCQSLVNLCQLDPCRNNGRCIVLRNGTRVCQCLSQYKGILCEQYITTFHSTTTKVYSSARLETDKGPNFGIIFGCLFATCTVLISIIGIYFFVRRYQGRPSITYQEKPVNLKKPKNSSSTKRLSNVYGICTDDEVYEEIDERATYVYQVENNDDYLVPSRPVTPALSIGNLSRNSEQISVFNEEYELGSDDITNENTRENEYFPALPTRTPKKKPFQFFFNFKA